MNSFQPATAAQMDALWDTIIAIDPSISQKATKKELQKSKALMTIYEHCVTERHYSFTYV